MISENGECNEGWRDSIVRKRLSEGKHLSHNPHDEKQPAPLQHNAYNETEDTIYPIYVH